jgi:transcriptional regulator with XRE-family HTH domain
MPEFDQVKQEWLKDPLVRAGLGQKDIYMQVARLVRKVRARSALTQQRVEQVTGIAQEEVSRIENGREGRTPGLGTLAALGSAADMELVVCYVTKEQAVLVRQKQQAGESLFALSEVLSSG